MTIFLKLILVPFLFNILMTSAVRAADQLPPDTPPQITDLTEDEPTVTQRKKERVQQSTQTIQNGEQTEVKVTNEIGTYIVKPNQSVGTSLPGDAQSSSNHAVQWVVKSWGGGQHTDPAATPPTLPSNPTNSNNQSK